MPNHLFSRFECIGMARRLPPDVARYFACCVSSTRDPLLLLNSLTNVLAQISRPSVPVSTPHPIPKGFDADLSVGTLSPPISYTCTLLVSTTTRGKRSLLPTLRYLTHAYPIATSRSSTPQRRSVTETSGRNTRPRWSTARTCKLSLTGGGTTPTVRHKHSLRSRSLRRLNSFNMRGFRTY